LDNYPLGYFLKPPKQPTEPEPEDFETDTNLKINLEVYVEDPDSDTLTVSFYRAETDTLIDGMYQNPVKNVHSGDRVSYSFTQPFNVTVAWYVTVNDSLLENRSDVWFFMTRAAPPDNIPPVADAGGPYSAEAFEPLQLDASGSKDPDGTISFYRWNFGDGSSQILEKNPNHIYRNTGTYTATLTIIDNDGSVDTDVTTVEILPNQNLEPTAVMNAPSKGYSGSVISFSSSESSDPNEDDLTYFWSFGDGNTSESANPTHVYSETGTYEVILKVSDWQYDDIVTDSITITKKPKEETPGFETISLLIVVLILAIIQKRKIR
jgi:PKD repeat protein